MQKISKTIRNAESMSREQDRHNRNEAIAAGSKTFHGRMCTYGHTLKYTNSRTCIDCLKRVSLTAGRKLYMKQYRESDTNKQRSKERNSGPRMKQRRREQKASEKYKENDKRYNRTKEGIESHFRAHLKRYYNITPERYYQIVEEQNYRCKICYQPFLCWEQTPDAFRDTHVDHCHSTGIVRGVLCKGCNHAIGNLKDNPNHCANAASYLVNTKSSSAVLQ